MEGRCTTLGHLKPDVQNWFVKALVAEKTPIRSFKWGKQQRLVLVDEENTSMQCIIYDQDVARLDEALQLYKTCFIGNDLLCAVIHVFPPRFIQKIKKNVQEFVVVNEECRPTIFTLWEEFLQNEGPLLIEHIHNTPIILGMRLSVNTYHGISIGTIPSSTILFDPPLPEAKHLESWLQAHKEYVDNIIRQKLYEKATQTIDRPLDSQIRKISQILGQAETVKSFWIKATAQVIKPGQYFYFLGCPDCSNACGAIYKNDFT